MSVNIANIPDEALLLALWKRSISTPCGKQFNYDDADFQKLLQKGLHDKYIDYLCGRAIKTQFNTMVNPVGFDNDKGKGAFQTVVTGLRASLKRDGVEKTLTDLREAVSNEQSKESQAEKDAAIKSITLHTQYQ